MKADFNKSFFGANQKALEEKLIGKKGRFFIVTDKQFGLTQNSWNDTPFVPNTKLTYHFEFDNFYYIINCYALNFF